MFVPLQFSRNPKVAEHPDAGVGLAPPQGASIQPQPKGRGTHGLGVAHAIDRGASIQPQPKGRGTRLTASTRTNVPGELQFSRNPKVAEHTALVPAGNYFCDLLQFSRNPKVAEHVTAGLRGLRHVAGLQFSRNPKVAEHAELAAGEVETAYASIQPQPKGRGTPTGARTVTPTHCRFNSAATQRSRNTSRPGHRRPARGGLQFSRNPKVAEHFGGEHSGTQGSVLQFSRNPKVAEHPGPGGFPSHDAKLQFSRNPKVAEHRYALKAPPSEPIVLQFSRNPKVAEHPSLAGDRVRLVDASIQPQPKGRGTPSRPPGRGPSRPGFNSAATQRSRNTAPKLRGRLRGLSTYASIQPQPKGRGTLRCSIRSRNSAPTGFNSAATQRSRNTLQKSDAAITKYRLQFSRNPKVAEHPQTILGPDADRRCFNSAATQRSRNTPGGVLGVDKPDEASIQPQPKGRGTRWRGGDRSCRVHALQFSRNPKVAEHPGRDAQPD